MRKINPPAMTKNSPPILSRKGSLTRVGSMPMLLLALSTFLPLTTIEAASAETFPSKPVRRIVPLPPGTASDFLARSLAARLSERYKQQVVVDNRAGAGGIIGSNLITKASADGYTLAIIGQPHLVAPLLVDTAPYRPLEDITAIAEVAAIPNVIAVGPGMPVKTLNELINTAKANPGKYNYPTLGYGTAAHLASEIFNRAAGIQAVHVPFKGMADIYTEMLASRVHYFVFTSPAALTMLREGKLSPLAVTTAKRSPTFPDLPTVIELNLTLAESSSWFGIVAPAKTSQSIIRQLHADILSALKESVINEQFSRQGAQPSIDTTPEKFMSFLQKEYTHYQTLFKSNHNTNPVQ